MADRKQYKELYLYYKKTLDSLNYSTTLVELYSYKTKISFNDLKNYGIFESYITTYFKGGNDTLSSVHLDSLINNLDKYIASKKLNELSIKLASDINNDIKRDYELLEKANNPVTWMFSSKNTKFLVDNSYNKLLKYKSNSYLADASELLEKANGIDNIKTNNPYKSLIEKHDVYLSAMLDIDKNIFESKFVLPLFKNLFISFDSINRKVMDIDKNLDKYKTAVNDAAERLLATELLNILKTIPVDELNREKKGIRVSALKLAGYNSMADIYTASTYQLASIYGISDDTAYLIKGIANNFADRSKKEIRIKISADNKTPTYTQLVNAVYAYKLINDNLKEINDFQKENDKKISEAISKVYSLKNGSKFIFLSEIEKKEYFDDYKYLSQVINGKYSEIVSNALEVSKRSFKVESTQAWEEFKNHPIEFNNIIEEVCPGILSDGDKLFGLPEDLARQIQEECIFPDGLLCTLRRYQEWGVKYILHQRNVLLGDEMGLGKTIQAIATMVSLKNIGETHFVVVCPLSVLSNWVREIAKHSKLKVIRIHGSGKQSSLRAWIAHGGVAVTTYETTSIFSFSDNFKFGLLVVDEAHYIKNPNAIRTKNIKDLSSHASRLLFMTGTALENKVDEMIELVSMLNEDIGEKLKPIAFMSAAPVFRETVAPIYYRRKRADVLTELPDLIESEEWVTLNDYETETYEQNVLDKQYMAARRVSFDVSDITKSSKANRMLEIIEDAKDDDRKIIVFSFFLETIRAVASLLGSRCIGIINGSVSANRRQEIIDNFDSAPSGSVLCCQIQSGGTGLNIQSASVVIICEPQLKPSTENQAISRAYRMGQARNVQVFRLLCEDTIEERICDILKQKQEEFDAFADKSVAAESSLEIDNTTISQIIEEEIVRIKAKRESSTVNVNPEEVIVEKEIKTVPLTFELEKVRKIEYNPSLSYLDELEMSYIGLVEHLISKYGEVQGDYFLTPTCRSKNSKISRIDEGLFIHHIDENKAANLSKEEQALLNPFEFQRKDRLVYCDILEHLILHIKIAEEPRNKHANNNEILGLGGAVNYIIRQINDVFSNKPSNSKVADKIKNTVKDQLSNYILILMRLLKVIDNNYMYSSIMSKRDLCLNSDDEVVETIYKFLK